MTFCLPFAVARLCPGTLSNALEPGWVPTKIGGPHAPDDLDLAHRTQVWLAASDETAAQVTGEYFFHGKPAKVLAAARNVSAQDQLLATCKKRSGVPFSR